MKIVGLGPDESTLAEGTSTEAPPPVGKRWQRALILIAGPLMNLVLALVLHTTVFALGVRVPEYELEPPVVRVVEAGSPGAAAGFQPGDRIVAIDGTATPRWRDAQFVFGMNARQKLDVEVDRGGSRLFFKVTPRAATKYDIGEVGLYPAAPREPRLVTVLAGDPADRAGLKKGDVIVSIAGRQIRGAPEDILNKFVQAIGQAAPGPFEISYLRDGKPGVTQIKPRHDPRRFLEGRRVRRRGPEGSHRAVPAGPGGRGGMAAGQDRFPDDALHPGAPLRRPGEPEDDVRAARHREVLGRGGAHGRRSPSWP